MTVSIFDDHIEREVLFGIYVAVGVNEVKGVVKSNSTEQRRDQICSVGGEKGNSYNI